jgi:hypothetical protein
MDFSIEAAAALVEEILLLAVLADFVADASLGDALAFVLVVFLAGAFFATFSITAFAGALVLVFLVATAFLAETDLVLVATFFVDAAFLAGAFALVLGADLVAAGLDFLAGGVVDLRGILLGWVIKIKL